MGKQGGIMMVVEAPKGLMLPQNPIADIQAKYKELESGFKNWLSKQSIPVEAAIVTVTSAIQGAAIGGLMGTLTNDASTSFPTPAAGLTPDAMASLKQAQALAGGPLVQARNFAVMTGVNAGISCVMKRVRGKEDVQTSMVAAFGSGAMFSLVSGMGGGPNPAANAVTSGLFFALLQGMPALTPGLASSSTMEVHLLSSAVVIFLSAAMAVSGASLAGEKYWNQVLPNTPMPKAIKDSLDVNAAVSTGVVVGGGGTTVNIHGPKSKTGVVVGGGGTHVNVHGPKSKTGVVVGKGGTTVNVHGPKSKTGVVVGTGGTSVHVNGPKGKRTYVSVKPGSKGFLYKYAATETQLHDNPNTALFFLEKDLITPKGKTMNLKFTTDPTTTFLPRQTVDSIPFSSEKLPEILRRLNVTPGSDAAAIVESTLKECEEKPIKGEDKRCVTSLETMVDYVTSKLGTHVYAVSTEAGNNKEEKYEVTKAKRLGHGEEAHAVVCHKQSYAYAVFYCHETSTTRVYEVSLKAVDKTKTEVKAVAVCHTDTSEWNPKHLAFMVLKVKPGTVPVCHFLPDDHVVWVSM